VVFSRFGFPCKTLVYCVCMWLLICSLFSYSATIGWYYHIDITLAFYGEKGLNFSINDSPSLWVIQQTSCTVLCVKCVICERSIQYDIKRIFCVVYVLIFYVNVAYSQKMVSETRHLNSGYENLKLVWLLRWYDLLLVYFEGKFAQPQVQLVTICFIGGD